MQKHVDIHVNNAMPHVYEACVCFDDGVVTVQVTSLQASDLLQ